MASPPSKANSNLGAEPFEPRGLLRRSDQALLAGLVAAGSLAVAIWWVHHGGLRGELVEWEKGEPREARFLVNVNTAEWPELSQLPEIGETLARRIIAHREENGPFLCPDDLMKVHGIGPKTLDLLRPLLDPESWPADSAEEGRTVPVPLRIE